MKILGIDPGTATTGFGVIDVKGSDKFTLLDLGLISTSKDLPHGQRLDLIYKQISQVITKNSPDVVAIERLFFATNALTAIAVGQAIGVIKLAIFHHHLEVFDYAPMQVKLMIGGTGKADKTLMKQTIKKMFHLRERKGDKTHFDNTADALAIAVCHAKKTLFFVLLLLFGIWNLGFGISSAQATYDPLAVPNNRIGIHILDPQEVIEAAKLVNSSNGDWGYVTVPIRSNDRDIAKWEKFFEECRRLHLIPIIRISTYPVKNVWERPTSFDLVDFANFLSRFSWPTKNRYIVLFNEPNHSYEWGGQVSVIEYTNLLIDASRIFKSASTDYFLLTAGLDMSAPTNNSSLEGLSFYRQMFAYRKDWPNYVDGLSVHAYPNPGFISSIYSKSKTGVKSYEYELNLLKSYGVTSKPIFITETGTKSSQQFFPGETRPTGHTL
jgi:crossover junction endodeoxyribonuclease RuvC